MITYDETDSWIHRHLYVFDGILWAVLVMGVTLGVLLR